MTVGGMSDAMVADLRADLERFRSGDDSTLDVENILDLIAAYEAVTRGWRAEIHAKAKLRADVEELTAILNTHRRQYTDGRLPTWVCEATDEEIIEILLPDQEQKREISDLRAGLVHALHAIDMLIAAQQPLPDAWFVERDASIRAAREALTSVV